MQKITIVALGWEEDDLTLRAIKELKSGRRVILRTQRMGAAQWLEKEGIAFETLDYLYDECEDFDELNERAAEAVLAAEEAVYGVADLRDETAKAVAEACGAKCIAGPAPEGALLVNAGEETMCAAACEWETISPSAHVDCLIREIDSRELASELKLRLMEAYPAQTKVDFLKPDGNIAHIELEDLDRMKEYSHRAAAYVSKEENIKQLERYDFMHLAEIVARLRAPDGCPWDREQTHERMRADLLEEAYEVIDAINDDDIDALYDELGDVLLQVVMHAQIGKEHGEFEISDVTTAICSKLIFRHPHVFGDLSASDSDEVLRLWEQQKKKEKKQETVAETMRTVTRALPATERARKVQKKAAMVNFDWDSALAALEKVHEEANEVAQAIRDASGVEEEIGDLFFAAVNVARLAKVDPEFALGGATKKFIDRFAKMEEMILADRGTLADMTLAEMDEYWNRVKKTM